MVCIDTYNSIDNVRYDVSESQVICKVHMQDGTMKEGIANVEERINVFGYFIPDIEDAKISALENALLNTKAV